MTKVTTYEELAAALQAGETYISVSETLKAPVYAIHSMDYKDILSGISAITGIVSLNPTITLLSSALSSITKGSKTNSVNLDTIIAAIKLSIAGGGYGVLQLLRNYLKDGDILRKEGSLEIKSQHSGLLGSIQNTYQQYLGNSFNLETGEFDSDAAQEIIQKERGNLNIVLLGATGAGKSSLVNAVFGDNVVRSKDGIPVTQYLEKIHIPKKGLTLWDTKGIEAKDYETTKEQLINDIKTGFQTAFDSGKDDEVPHVAWLCIKESSRRIEGREFELLDILRAFGIPTVIVFTDTEAEAGQTFYTQAVAKLNEEYGAFLKNRFVRVNSVSYSFRGMTVPIEGLEDLITKTESCLADADRNTENQKAKHIEALRKAQQVDTKQKKKSMTEGAQKCVHLAAGAAGAAGAIPIPFADAPIIAAIQGKMIFAINAEFEMEMSKNTTLSIIAGMLGSTALATVGKTIVSSLMKFVPWAGSFSGGAISAVTAAAITEAVGQAYIQVLLSFFNDKTGKVEISDNVIEILSLFKNYYQKPELSK